MSLGPRRTMWKPSRLERSEEHAHETTSKCSSKICLRATDEEIAGVVMPEGTGYVCAAVRAQKILLERRLVHWVQRANRQQGVAPTTSMVLDAAEAQRMADPRADELRPHGAAHEGRARMWAWRWRRRWGGRFGVIPSREPLTMPDMRSKVQPWGRTPAQFWSELGP